jgi:hypothetical protein
MLGNLRWGRGNHEIHETHENWMRSLSDDAFVMDIRGVAGDHEQAEFVASGLRAGFGAARRSQSGRGLARRVSNYGILCCGANWLNGGCSGVYECS